MKRTIISTSLIGLALVAAAICWGTNAFAFGVNVQTQQASHRHRSFKSACAQAPQGYARCLALISTTAVPAPSTGQASVIAPRKETAGVVKPAANPLGEGAPYGPSDLLNAYNLSGNAPNNQTVAIVDANDDPNAESDMNAYRSHFGLPACTSDNGCFQKVDQNGGTNYPTADSGWAGEISLDLDMVSAICQNCHILLVEANSASFGDLGTAVNTAASLGANEISNSYGGGEGSDDASTCDAFYNHPGVAITASSGDQGPGVESPADCPHVVAVGGTTLNSDGSETDWSAAGGACSSFIGQPSWENNGLTGCNNRAVADVSAVADPSTGVYVYDTYQSGGWMQIGGTSASSPIIASVYALAGGVSGDAASVPWSNYNNGCLFQVGGSQYSYQGGLGSPNGTSCF